MYYARAFLTCSDGPEVAFRPDQAVVENEHNTERSQAVDEDEVALEAQIQVLSLKLELGGYLTLKSQQ